MTKIRQKRFSNGKIQTQKSLSLKEVKAMSLADAYAIVGGYKHISAKSAEMRILIYKRAVEMVQKDDAQFAKLLQEDKAKPNQKVKHSLDLTEAYNIVGGYEKADKKTFKQAIELLRADTTDPEFAALLIKFAESHSSFSDADDETLTKINEEGLAFFDNLDIKKVVENVLKDEEVQQAFNATPVAAKTETPKAEELINEIAQKGTIYSAATKAMEMPQSGNDENAFEEDVKKQTAAQIISLRLEEVNKDYDESVIEAIKSNSEKPLSAFRKKMKKAWDFTKKISISPESVEKVCNEAKTKWNKFARKVSISAKTKIASIEYTLPRLTPRGRAAILTGLMFTSIFLTSCSNSGNNKTLTQEEIEAQRKAAEEKAKQDSISFAKAQKQAAIEKANKEAAAKKAHRDSIMNMAVPHEWNDSMKYHTDNTDYQTTLKFYNKLDSARFDRMYRNATLIQDSLPTFQHKGDSVATQVSPDALLRRVRQQLGFKFQEEKQEVKNADGTTTTKTETVVRPAYIAAQNIMGLLDRPCDGQEFEYVEGMKGDMQLLFDTDVPTGDKIVANAYANRPDCGDDVKVFGSVQTPKKEAVDNTTIVLSDSIDNKKGTLSLGVDTKLTIEERTDTTVMHTAVEKRKTNTDSNGKTLKVTNKGSATVDEAIKVGDNAANNKGKVFVSDGAQTNEATSEFTLGVDSSVQESTSETADATTNLTKNKTSTDKNGNVTAVSNAGTATVDEAVKVGEAAAENKNKVFASDGAQTNEATSEFTLGVDSSVQESTSETTGVATNLTKNKTSTNSKGDVTAVSNNGTATAEEAIKVGEAAAENTNKVYTSQTATTQYSDSTITKTDIVLGVDSETRSDTTMVADSVKNVQADSTFTSSIGNNDFALPVDTIGWDILRPEKDSIPAGAQSALGEMSGRGGYNFTSVSEKAIKDDKKFLGEAAYEKGIERFSQHPELFVYGGPLEGLTPQEAMNGLTRSMKWSVKKNGDFAKFRKEVLAIMDFAKGCKDTFTAEEAVAIKNLYNAIRANGTIDNVIGRNNSRNSSYTFGKECGEKGTPTFKDTNDFGPTNPSGSYLEKAYAVPRTAPSLSLGVDAEIVYVKVQELEAQPVNLEKRKTNTDSQGKTLKVTNKGKADVNDAVNAGNNAAQNDGTVFVPQNIR